MRFGSRAAHACTLQPVVLFFVSYGFVLARVSPSSHMNYGFVGRVWNCRCDFVFLLMYIYASTLLHEPAFVRARCSCGSIARVRCRPFVACLLTYVPCVLATMCPLSVRCNICGVLAFFTGNPATTIFYKQFSRREHELSTWLYPRRWWLRNALHIFHFF